MSEWQDISTAPHGEEVLLGWWTQDGHGGVNWECEVHAASWGWQRDGITYRGRRVQATHWMPLPSPPEAK
jgi:hypothetical protein